MWVYNSRRACCGQNAIGDRNSVKLGGLTLLTHYWATAPFLIICLILLWYGTTDPIHCANRVPLKMVVHVTPDTLLFELLRAKNNSNAASKTFKPIVQYYYVVLCEFESERKWIVGAVPTTWQKLKVFNASFVDKANIYFPLAYLQKRRHIYMDRSRSVNR